MPSRSISVFLPSGVFFRGVPGNRFKHVLEQPEELSADGNGTAKNVQRAVSEFKCAQGSPSKAVRAKKSGRGRTNPKPALKLVEKAAKAADGNAVVLELLAKLRDWLLKE